MGLDGVWQVSVDFGGFRRVSLVFCWFRWVSAGFSGFRRVSVGLGWFRWVSAFLRGFRRVLADFNGGVSAGFDLSEKITSLLGRHNIKVSEKPVRTVVSFS